MFLMLSLMLLLNSAVSSYSVTINTDSRNIPYIITSNKNIGLYSAIYDNIYIITYSPSNNTFTVSINNLIIGGLNATVVIVNGITFRLLNNKN